MEGIIPTLFMIPLHDDKTDINGNVFDGDRVSSKDFAPNDSMQHGIVGYSNGKTRTGQPLAPKMTDLWALVKAQSSTRDTVQINDESGALWKFKEGRVLKVGTAAEVALRLANEDQTLTGHARENMAGYEMVTVGAGHNAFSHSLRGKASTKGLASNAIVTGVLAQAKAQGEESHAVAFGDNSESVAAQAFGVAMTMGNQSSSIALGDFGKALNTGISGRAFGTSTGSLAACLEPGGQCSTGHAGSIIMAYYDGDRIRFAVGYVGEGIKANTVYKCVQGQFVEAQPENEDHSSN